MAVATRQVLWRDDSMFGEAQAFYTELCNQGLEGLCTCVYEGYNFYRHERAPTCRRAPLLQSLNYLSHPKWWIKSVQDISVRTRCRCHITSSSDDEPLEWR